MKIAAIVPEYPPCELGGGGVVFEGLARAYLSDGHEVKVFSGLDGVRAWFARPAADERQGLPIARYPLMPLGTKTPHFRSLPPPGLAVIHLWGDLREWNPDVAHLHGYGHAFVDLAARFVRGMRVPYVFTVHGLPRTPNRRSRPVRAAYSFYQLCGPDRTFEHAATATAVSKALAGELPGSEDVVVIPNGLTPLPPPSAEGVETLRRRLGISQDSPLVAAAGRLSWSKGFDVLIEALDRFPTQNVTCVVAGADAGERLRLEALSRRRTDGLRVTFAGAMDRQGLADLFSLASVIAIPSRDEPFGLVGLEALAAGRRVVASRVGGLIDYLRPPVAELVPTQEPDALAAAIHRATLRGPFSSAELRVADEILLDHSWDRIAQRYESLLENAVRGRRGGAEVPTRPTEVREKRWDQGPPHDRHP